MEWNGGRGWNVRSISVAPSAIHELPAADSTCRRYFAIASLANLFLHGNCCAIVVKVRLCNTSASSNEIAEFSRKNGSKSNAHWYDTDW